MRIRALEAPVVKLDMLVDVLKSKDAGQWEAAKWIFDNNNCPHFLDGAPNNKNKIAFASFPRSGNSFLRKYFEMLTGITTGADNTLHINIPLQMMGMKGEDIVDGSVWVVKTHSPWCMADAPLFFSNKNIIIVRNPLDIVVSWLNLLAYGNHSWKAPFNYDEKFPNWWDWWVKDCVTLIKEWFKVTMEDAKMRKVPTLWVRFEDLVTDPKPQLENIMKFMLGLDNLAGTNAERRVNEVIAKGKAATQTYTLKKTTHNFNYSEARYTKE